MYGVHFHDESMVLLVKQVMTGCTNRLAKSLSKWPSSEITLILRELVPLLLPNLPECASFTLILTIQPNMRYSRLFGSPNTTKFDYNQISSIPLPFVNPKFHFFIRFLSQLASANSSSLSSILHIGFLDMALNIYLFYPRNYIPAFETRSGLLDIPHVFSALNVVIGALYANQTTCSITLSHPIHVLWPKGVHLTDRCMDGYLAERRQNIWRTMEREGILKRINRIRDWLCWRVEDEGFEAYIDLTEFSS